MGFERREGQVKQTGFGKTVLTCPRSVSLNILALIFSCNGRAKSDLQMLSQTGIKRCMYVLTFSCI